MTGVDTDPQAQYNIEGVEGAHLQREPCAHRLKAEQRTMLDDNNKD